MHKICMDHLLAVMKNPSERGSGFVALAEMAGAVGKELESYLPLVTVPLKEAVRLHTIFLIQEKGVYFGY